MSAEDRARRGLVQVRGGDVFPGLTVDENLRAALAAHPALRRDAGERIARVYDVFPALAAHRRQDTASLSGGEQQMVALGCRAPVRARAVAGRRAVARVGTPRRAAPGRRAARTARAGPGHGGRRTVADRGGAIVRTRRVPREGHRPVRRSGRPSSPRGTSSRARSIWAATGDHRPRLGHQPADAAERGGPGAGVRGARRRHRARLPRQRCHQLRGRGVRDHRGRVHGGAARGRDRRMARTVLGRVRAGDGGGGAGRRVGGMGASSAGWRTPLAWSCWSRPSASRRCSSWSRCSSPT